MNKVGQVERATQDRVIKLFTEKLGYEYLGNLQDKEDNKNVEIRLLKKYLKSRGYNDKLIDRALYQLNKAVTNQSESLYSVNKEVYGLLRYGIEVRENIGENKQTVKLIDWEEPYNNNFYIAEEVTVKGQHTKRPDIVLYVNGIALGILELKRSTVHVAKAIRQNLDNQQSEFIKPFFHTIQLIMAGNDTEGLKYGTIETPEKYYLKWKEDPKAKDKLSEHISLLHSRVKSRLDKDLISLCQKERFLDIIHDFVVYDSGRKKLCRPNQYFGVKAAIDRVKKKEGGIIWHTQGSGKSLTMVWLAKWIRENISNSRILIITDREELDEQIEKVFLGVNEDIYRTKSGKDLIEKLNQTTPLMMCSLIHKFGARGYTDEEEQYEKQYDEYIKEVRNNLPKDFKPKGDIYVFVDECHRTQSGKLHRAMKEILPDSMFIGFTGTPLLKKDKPTSIEIFGPYIHTYKFDEAVEDKVVLDLCYEARDIEQKITSQEKIDMWFEAQTRELTDYAKGKLKQKWGTMQAVLSSRSRLEQIVKDIILDMETKDRLKSGRGNAILVSSSIYEACKYYELFQSAGFKKCAVITSYNPHISDIKGETTGEDRDTENVEKYRIYKEMLGDKSPEEFEKEVKKKFIEEPDQMKLLIVVDKLLTGFDAPPATYLYIDKKMQDHNLFQAICRVNRLDGEDKEYGYIIDYMDLFKSLEKAVADYTSEAFANYDREDVEGLLKNRLEKGKERLEEALEKIRALCEPVEPPKGTNEYIKYFCGEDQFSLKELKEREERRLTLYKYTASLTRAYANIANDMLELGYSIKEIKKIKEEVKHYDNVRREVMIAAGDDIDLKAYEPAMRHLIDSYIGAEESRTISAFEDNTLVELIVKKETAAVDDLPENIKRNKEAVAATIENNVRRLIVEKSPADPKYYERMSVLLDELIRKRKKEAIEYEEYLKEIAKIAKDSFEYRASTYVYPKEINTDERIALYNNLDQNKELAIAIDESLKKNRPAGWRDNPRKRRYVISLIKEHIEDEDLVQKIYKIVEEQEGY